MKHAPRVALAALALTLLTACGGGDHNDADVAFATGMVPHHEQAVSMAELAADNGASPEVQALAERIEQAQGPEIETMEGWLEEWGEDHHGGGHGSDDHEMPGMMGEGDLEDLEGATGEEFDRLFLTQMIEHHRGAVEMAVTEQEDGKSEEAVELAKRVEETQTREIEEMERLLAR
jgi:uncharacterized protein (DUF305 family)